MNIKVVDLQNKEVAEEATTINPIDEEKEEIPESVVNTANEIIEEPTEEVKEVVKEEVKEKPKRQTQKDRIQCPKCLKEVSLKTYRYSHEKICQGHLSDKPVKKQARPKAKQKQTPKPPHEVTSQQRVPEPAYYESSEEEQQPQQKPII